MESLREKSREFEIVLKQIYVKKGPRLPKSAALLLVRILPYIIALTIVPLVCNLLITFGVIRNSFISLVAGVGGFVSVFAPEAFGFIDRSLEVTAILALLWLAAVLVALPHLLHRNLWGWRLVWYATMITLFDAFLYLDLTKIVLHLVVVWYLLMQIRRYYH